MAVLNLARELNDCPNPLTISLQKRSSRDIGMIDPKLPHSLVLSLRHDAIFAVSDEVAIGALIRLKQGGTRVPNDIAAAGFDNDKIAELTMPALTSVDIKRSKTEKRAIQLFRERNPAGTKDVDFWEEIIHFEIEVPSSTFFHM